mmetsp:Transcript_28256/g.42782  ORF Transcript_28256/g.42782 Transcript_28256/m.42782 type:complete len:84 (-) Transcript_28256:479-730(-)
MISSGYANSSSIKSSKKKSVVKDSARLAKKKCRQEPAPKDDLIMHDPSEISDSIDEDEQAILDERPPTNPDEFLLESEFEKIS